MNPMSTKSIHASQQVNKEFYNNCTEYFTALREKGKNDFSFEDEYFYTLPAISGKN